MVLADTAQAAEDETASDSCDPSDSGLRGSARAQVLSSAKAIADAGQRNEAQRRYALCIIEC